MTRSLRVPLFPLAGAILFPRSQLPLHIFEPRYREMVRDSIEGAGRIGMIQPQQSEEADRPALFAVGCVGDIVGVEELEDGRFNIVLHGANRFRLEQEVDLGTPYRSAEVVIDTLDDSEPPPLALVQRSAVEQEARRLGDVLGLAVDWSAVSRLDDETLVNAIAQVAPFDVGAKQALLEAEHLDERTSLLIQLMQFHRMAVSGGGGEVETTLQ